MQNAPDTAKQRVGLEGFFRSEDVVANSPDVVEAYIDNIVIEEIARPLQRIIWLNSTIVSLGSSFL